MTRPQAAMGWFIWNGMRALAVLGLALLGTSVVLLIWFMFKVGLAWVSIVAIGAALLLTLPLLKALYRRGRTR